MNKNDYICIYFNPRPRKEGDKVGCLFKRHRTYFNPRPRKEGDVFVSA